MSRFRLQKIHSHFSILAMLIAPLFLLGLTQNCSEMKSSVLSGELTSSTEVCSTQYNPPSSITQKLSSFNSSLTHFEIKKNHLQSDFLAKSSSTLKGKTIFVTLETACESQAGSLSAKVRAQSEDAPGSPRATPFRRQAFSYVVEDDFAADEMGRLADEDPCVVGLTPPGEVHTGSTPATGAVVNDSRYTEQAHLSAPWFRDVHKYFVDEQNSSRPVRVGFVDTGADCNHPDLAANLVSGCGFDAVSSTSPEDNDGHGSHTMGLVGAVMNNSNGVSGLVGNAIELHAIRVINVNSGSVTTAYNGIQYAIDQNLDVINVSLESSTRQTLIEQGVQEAVAAGIVVIVAAGNQGEVLGTGTFSSPAMIGKSTDGAITVGSTDVKSGLMSTYSNYGDMVEMGAPGAYDSYISMIVGGLLSTSRDGTYEKMMGTSQAAPVVAAAAALAVQFFKQRNVNYSPADIERLLAASTDSRAGINFENGRVLNMYRLIRNTYAFAGLDPCPSAAEDAP